MVDRVGRKDRKDKLPDLKFGDYRMPEDSALKSAAKKVGKYVAEYAPREKAKLDKHGTLGLGIAPKLGPIIPTGKGGRSGHASKGMGSSAAAASKPKPAASKASGPPPAKRSAPKPSAPKSYSSGSITKPDAKSKKSRDELGAFYLNATSGMDIHSRKKK